MLTSAADILNVSTGLCFSNNNFYQLAPLLAVRVQNGVLWTADARETAWQHVHSFSWHKDHSSSTLPSHHGCPGPWSSFSTH